MPIRYSILIVFFFLYSSSIVYSQVDYCNDFKTGVFQFLGYNGGYYTVVRTDSSQYERNSKQAQHSKMKLKWENKCHYTLFDRVVYKWGEEPAKDSDVKELRNIVYKFEKPNKFYVKTFMQGFPDTVETLFIKVDTTGYYQNLFQLEMFAEYQNSKSYGQTQLGEIHSINYYESNKMPNKYIITFETTYHSETFDKTKLLDSVIIQLKENEHIAISNCRFKSEYDDEIVVMYRSQNEDKEASIIQAFRCSRISGKIEKVDIQSVQYKESDRDRIKW